MLFCSLCPLLYTKHSDKNIAFDILGEQLNNGLEAFVTEMKNQGMWDKITIVGVSEFGRTLSENSGMYMK